MRFLMMISVALCASTGAASASDDFVSFKAPSGNINCAWYKTDAGPEVRCDIRKFSASFKRPSDCELDWGYAFAIGAKSGKGAVLCAGDTVVSPDASVLAYGKTFSKGGLACVSSTSGMTCKNKNGRGFSISRAKQRIF